jgi:hypothetical protein
LPSQIGIEVAVKQIQTEGFSKFVMFVDRVTSHCSKIIRKFLDENKHVIKLDYFPVGPLQFNAVE